MGHFFDRFPGAGYLCAHRGARSLAPENSLLALDKARLCGADLWETDIQFSADAQPVIFHDSDLRRTTDIAQIHPQQKRKSHAVAAYTVDQLWTLNAGSWFLRQDPFGTIRSGEVTEIDFAAIERQKIPTLAEVLDYCRSYNFPVNLEIKDQGQRFSSELVATMVLTEIQRLGAEELVLLSSFNHDYLRAIRKQLPELATAALAEERHPDHLIAYLHDLGVEAYHPDWQITDASLIARLNEAGIRVNLWTVNDVDQARFFAAAGVTLICTDWPQRMSDVRHCA